jgi:Mn2+/Fe2+ NRAMP family transporter
MRRSHTNKRSFYKFGPTFWNSFLNIQTMWKKLGPGVLLAGAAIGGSHLVASTQAGATYGWALLGILFLVNLFKYPFFLYAQRYTAATGKSILEGYLQLGRPYLILFFLLSIFSGIVNIAGVSMVAGSLAMNFGIPQLGVPWLSGVLMGICVLVIALGGYPLLKRFGKVIVLVLGVSTLVAMAISVFNGPVAPPDFAGESPWTLASFGFVIMFMGWMPAPIDVSVWPSLWMKSQSKRNAGTPGSEAPFHMRSVMTDFHVGYSASVFFAFIFLILGKMVMFGSGTELSSQGSVFARQLIDLYSATIGGWSRPLIIIAAFSAMFSTTLTTIDAYPRSLATCWELLISKGRIPFRRLHHIWLIVGSVLGFLIITLFVDSLGDMLSLAMILSFLTAPFFALLNYKVMLGKDVPGPYRPNLWQKLLSVSGIVFLGGFGLVFIYWYFFL